MSSTDGHRLVVAALGGNAISQPGSPSDIPHQFAHTASTADGLADLIEAGYRLVITHGNGPQVGQILRRVEIASPEVYPLPLDICVADSQGGMGYMIAQCVMNELIRRNKPQGVTAMLTTVEVDPADPAFATPTKPIGALLPPADVAERQRQGWVLAEVQPGQHRRVVASPVPLHIVEGESIRRLVDAGFLIIACGGGGIPVVRNQQGAYEGVAAVVDKDLASALLAQEINADCLLILTAVDQVCLHFGTPNQKSLDHLTVSQAQRFLDEGHFPPGSMGPKIEAAIRFLENAGSPDAEVIITRPEQVLAGMHGRTGTRVTRD